MSTRANIAIKEKGTYRYIYNHYDSGIDWLGITLYKYYKDINKVRELIALGNTSSIGPTVEEGGSKSYKEHMSKSFEKRGTVAYFREGNRWDDYYGATNWKDEKPLETKYFLDLCGECYVYVFDTENNRWYFAYRLDKYRLRDLEKTLHSKELLKKVFIGDYDEYTENYLSEFYNKCLNA